MIAADTSTWIAYLEGSDGDDVRLLDQALTQRQVLMVPTVLTELLSDPRLAPDLAQLLVDVPLIEVKPGFWMRAGMLRAVVLGRRRKARLGDALIAQACLDRGLPLLTRDHDFQAFSEAAGLDLAVG